MAWLGAGLAVGLWELYGQIQEGCCPKTQRATSTPKLGRSGAPCETEADRRRTDRQIRDAIQTQTWLVVDRRLVVDRLLLDRLANVYPSAPPNLGRDVIPLL